MTIDIDFWSQKFIVSNIRRDWDQGLFNRWKLKAVYSYICLWGGFIQEIISTRRSLKTKF